MNVLAASHDRGGSDDTLRAEAASLSRIVGNMLPIGCLGAVRPICPGDEMLLRESEGIGLERSVVAVRRASGTGRELARSLCYQLGVSVTHIPRLQSRIPLWPAGVVGSIAHDRAFAAAAVAPADRFEGVGIDIEPTGPLPFGVAPLVGSPAELRAIQDFCFVDKALFCIKEAVFKAVFPADGIFLDFSDVTVDPSSQTARTCNGRSVCWRVRVSSRILALAWSCPCP